MEDRRVHTEEWEYDQLSNQEDSEFYKKQLEFYQDSEEEEEENDAEEVIDPHNYKGIYIDEEPGTKFQDPDTGAHFDYGEMCGKLLEVEVDLRRSQERDKKTIEKNQELLKNENGTKPYNNSLLFRTQDNSKPKNIYIQNGINEPFNLGAAKMGLSYDSYHLKTSNTNHMSSVGVVKTIGNPMIDNSKTLSKSAKKRAPKKVSDLIYLKKKPSNKVKGVNKKNINILIGQKDRDLKKIFKNNKALSKYQKYLYKQENVNNLAYPTITETRSTRNTFGVQSSQDRKLYEILTGTKSSQYYGNSSKKQKQPNRKSSRSNTSRKAAEVQGKKSLTRLENWNDRKFFDTKNHGRHFQSFHNGAMNFKKHTPKNFLGDKLYTIGTNDRDVQKILIEGSNERLKVESGKNAANKNLVINLTNQLGFPKAHQSYWKIPGSTKAMYLNMLSSSTKHKKRTSSKLKQKVSKKPTVKHYKNEYSNYSKGNQIGSLANNYSVESYSSKPNKRTISHTGVLSQQMHQPKPSITKKPGCKNMSSSQIKKKQRSKTKSEKSVVFMMPSQHIKNQFINFCK